MLATGFNWKQARSSVFVHKTEYERTRIGLECIRIVPSDFSVAAENVSAGCPYDCQCPRLVVALGMKASCFESIATGSIEQLEPFSSQIAKPKLKR